jgi:hypothetical protein
MLRHRHWVNTNQTGGIRSEQKMIEIAATKGLPSHKIITRENELKQLKTK